MQCRGALPDAIIYNAPISGCEKGMQRERALELFRAMQRLCVAPDIITYNSLLSACEKGGHLKKWADEEVLEAMRRQCVVPDAITYHTLIDACEEASAKRAG